MYYLAEKTGQFLSKDLRKKTQTLEWLNWQMGGLGPMAGQNHHFSIYAPEKIEYAQQRYIKETARLYAVLNKQLKDRDFIAGDYSIADMACYPWIVPHEAQSQNLNDYPYLKAWYDRIASRPATVRAYDKASQINTQPSVTDEQSRKLLFGQDASSIK